VATSTRLVGAPFFSFGFSRFVNQVVEADYVATCCTKRVKVVDIKRKRFFSRGSCHQSAAQTICLGMLASF